MTDQDRDTLQLQRLVEADRPHPSGPDVAALLTAGHRRLRRRRAVTGAASLAAVAAIAVPAYVGSGLGERPADNSGVAVSPTDAPPSTSGTPGCGVLLCVDSTKTVVEDGELVGDPWVLSEPADGVEEVVYTARTEGFDLATGEPGLVDVLMLGYRRGGELHRLAATVQPGFEAVSPAGETVSLWSNGGRLGEPDSDVFFVVGYVDGTPDQITWSTPDGTEGTVDGLDTATVPGRTVFYVALPRSEGAQGAERPDRTQDPKSGGEVLLGGASQSSVPDLTFHSSDGWSCSLKDCGSLG